MEKINYPIIGAHYSHYKGGLYEVISMAVHTETGEPHVIYKSLLFGTINARPLSSWNEMVEHNNCKFQRFVLINSRITDPITITY